MDNHADVTGTAFTDADIERWAGVAESDAGYTGDHLGPARPGRPVSVGAHAKPFTLRLDAARRAKLDEAAQARGTTPSQLVRDLIDSL